MHNATAASLLDLLLPDWHRLLQGWAADGRLTAAAQEALMLSGEPPLLRELTSQWAAGDFSSLPPIVLLSSSDMNGAMGAYAISTGTIYLNADWYVGASRDQVFAVLTEELGHSLDAKLNAVDTQGDEGEYFSILLTGTIKTEVQIQEIRQENDHGFILNGGQDIATESAAATNSLNLVAIQAGGPNSDWPQRLTPPCHMGDIYYREITNRSQSLTILSF